MKKLLLFLFFLFCIEFGYTQVGINTTTPNAQLDIKSSNQATPSNTDGILIPKVDAFPLTNPTAAQNSMMVYLNVDLPGKPKGFYYWDNATTSWAPISKTDDDWYEVGGTTAPNNINDTMFHSGNVGVGNTNPFYKLDVVESSNAKASAMSVVHNNPLNNSVVNALRTTISSSQTDGDITSVRNSIITSNNVAGTGVLNSMTGTSNATITGVSNAISTSGASPRMGVVNSFTGTAASVMLGIFNNFNSNTATAIFGMVNNMLTNGNASKVGLDNSIKNSIGGFHNGVHNTFADNNGSLEEKGMFSEFSGIGNANQYGINSDFNNTGNGIHYGMYNRLRGIGSGEHNGIFNTFTGSGVGNQYGMQNDFDMSGNSDNAGVFNWMKGTGIGTHVGVSNWMSGTGNGPQYANYNYIDNSGTGDKYGTYTYIPPPTNGLHYGVYSNVTKANSYSGYFLGRFSIGTTTVNNYILPLSRGTVNQIMQTDGIGNVSWQSPSTIIGNNAWSTTGNTGTSPGTNFIGTTDDIDFVFKRKNLNSGIIGKFSTAFGDQALASVTSGVHNVAFGSFALNSATTGNSNTGLGKNALEANTVGSDNTAVGREALVYNIRSNDNVAIGRSAMASNTSGSKNVAVGSGALLVQDFDNVGVAYNTNNVAVGFESMYNNNPSSNANGINNTAVGTYSLRTNIIGFRNVAVGINALYSNTNGNYNTALGSFSYGSGSFSNSVAIGDAVGISASNQVRIGDGGVTSIGGFANWTNVSDKRFKKDIQQNVPGLDFIKKLQPVTYHLDMDAIARLMKTPDELRKKESEVEKGKLLQTGFIAQDVEVAAKELGFDFSGVDAPKNESDFYGLRYAEFVVPLVKAVQEQQEIIDNQKTKILLLEERLKAIEEKLSK